MVRHCAVENCSNTDATTIAHRFPRKKQHADQWRKSLNLHRFALTDLISKYVVCTQHFIASDYRHCESNFLNFTAIPKLTSNDLLPPTSSTSKLQSGSRKSVPLTSFAAVQLQQKRRRAKLKQLNQKSKILATTTVLPKTIVKIPAAPLDEEENVEYNSDQNNEVDVIELFEEMEEDPVKIIDTPFTLGKLHENSSSQDNVMDNEVEIIDELPYYIEEEIDKDEEDQEFLDKTNLKSPSLQFEITVEPITVDVSVSTDDIMESDITDSNRDYVHLSKLELIQKLIVANEKITELEMNLVKMKTSQKEMNDKMEIIQQLIRN